VSFYALAVAGMVVRPIAAFVAVAEPTGLALVTVAMVVDQGRLGQKKEGPDDQVQHDGLAFYWGHSPAI
jgi:hypothetical protein